MTAEYNSERYAIINRWDPTHLEKIDRLLDLQPGDRVLEIGCGQGHLTKRLAERGIDITGIDANPNASHVSGSERVLYMMAEALQFDDGVFDSIVSVHAIEHIPDLKGAFAEMSRILKPGGKALFIYPAEPIMGLFAETAQGPGDDRHAETGDRGAHHEVVEEVHPSVPARCVVASITLPAMSWAWS
jgi:2-polyprenyl-3-methyl-5-hydroxy-6-metoxy-1,4-benzoquinol methylase